MTMLAPTTINGRTVRALMAASALLAAALGCTTKRIDPRAIDSLLTRDIPVGTPYDSATDILAARQIPHSPYDAKLRVIRGDLRNAETGFLYARDILILLYFDANGRLAKHSVEVVTEGP
jgi:hypothetical protein